VLNHNYGYETEMLKLNMKLEVKAHLCEIGSSSKFEMRRWCEFFIMFFSIVNNKDKVLSAVLCDRRPVAFKTSP
jgi:hypothetical protein